MDEGDGLNSECEVMLDKNNSSGASVIGQITDSVSASANPDALAQLYAGHVAEKFARFQTILKDSQYQAVVIASGSFKAQFQDDLSYPFKANPYFREWLPLNRRRDAFLVIEAGSDRPTLFLNCAEDIWHTAPQAVPAGFESPLSIVEYTKFETVKKYLDNIQGAVALLGEQNRPEVAATHWNPKVITNAIDYQRRGKTAYEKYCVGQANRLAAPAHLAARDAFLADASEYEIAAAYLLACQCTESEMPYGIIAGVNEHAAVLHHYELDKQCPDKPLSFLIDAGVDFHGYASDISRTYAFDKGSDFAAMIQRLDKKQLELVAAGFIGQCPGEMHRLMLRAIAEILIEFKVLNMSLEEATASELISSFCPHGLGHHLGVNVHDRGTQLASPRGDLYEPLKTYPKMRHLAPMIANQIYTIEPGIYFIPSVLDKLRNSVNASQINWAQVEAFLPYGGIRIEDNIVLHADGGLENLTRDAFNQLA